MNKIEYQVVISSMEKNKVGKRDRGVCVCVRCVSSLKRVVREALSEKVAFEQRPDLGVEVGRHVDGSGYLCEFVYMCLLTPKVLNQNNFFTIIMSFVVHFQSNTT